jgi:hypothetical protein
MYEIVKIQMHFQSNYLIFWFFFNRYVDLGKIFKNFFFHLDKLWKKKMVKVGFFCMGQRMMWDNIVNLSHIF